MPTSAVFLEGVVLMLKIDRKAPFFNRVVD
jgi:hypothetical protein